MPMRLRIQIRLAALLLMFFALPLLAQPARGKLTVTWFDMKVHGLAVALETPSGKVLLVDTGGRDAKSDYIAARDVVSPFLKDRGHKEISAMVISHPHADHYGGADWWLNNWPVKQMIDSGYEGRAQTG